MIVDRALMLCLVIVGALVLFNGVSSYRVCGLAQSLPPQMICQTHSGLGLWLAELLPERP